MPSAVAIGYFVMCCLPAFVSASAAAVCDSSDPAFVCGVRHAEDLVRLPGTSWVVASQFSMDVTPGSRPKFRFLPGPLQTIRIDSRQVSTLFPAPGAGIDWDRETYPSCEAPPVSFTSQGLNVRPLGGNRFRLYAVNHGARESIEIIDVEDIGQQVAARWRGCLLPKEDADVSPNSVAPLPDGGIIVSGPDGVAAWHHGRGWQRIASIESSNGVEVSLDGRWIFAVDSRSQLLIRVAVNSKEKPETVKLNFHPDNLRWGEDGRLYVAGSWRHSIGAPFSCLARPVCDNPFVVAQIDPQAFTVREIFRSGENGLQGVFGSASTALQMGDQVWVGTVRGDRVAILPYRKQK